MEKSSKETMEETLKWVHIAISNAKRNLLGNYLQAQQVLFWRKLFDKLVIANIAEYVNKLIIGVLYVIFFFCTQCMIFIMFSVFMI